MRKSIETHLNLVLKHLYINPLEKCNLKCRICYTRKTSPILTEKEIIDYVSRYLKVVPLQTITFCGGEVFTLDYFPKLINKLTAEGIFVQIITNGTIDKLDEFEKANFVNLIVSLDGLETYHDKNRGEGNFEKSIKFLKKAHLLGFHTEIFSIITRQNIDEIDVFEEYVNKIVILNTFDKLSVNSVKNPVSNSENAGDPSSRYTAGLRMTKMPITYHPRKPPSYLTHHPISNIVGAIDGFDFLTDEEMILVMRNRKTFPPKELGCYQMVLVSDGKVYGCCEGTVDIGKMDDDINYLIDKLKERVIWWERENNLKNCLGCSQPDFVCGIKKYLRILNNQTRITYKNGN